jgi:hypothetical protein
MKGQSVILEFITFFLISFTIFSLVGFFFYMQSKYFSGEVFEYEARVMNDVIAIDMLKASECKACSRMSIWEELPRKMGDSFFTVNVSTAAGVNTTSIGDEPFSVASPIFNLNETYTFSGQADSVNKKTQIKINNDGRTIEVV